MLALNKEVEYYVIRFAMHLTHYYWDGGMWVTNVLDAKHYPTAYKAHKAAVDLEKVLIDGIPGIHRSEVNVIADIWL